MSSNMFGFECAFAIGDRWYLAQIVYTGSDEMSNVIPDWAEDDPVELAKWELDHRDWDKKPLDDVRIGVCRVNGGWLLIDPQDSIWSPPTPTEREILEIIAAGKAEVGFPGWDT